MKELYKDYIRLRREERLTGHSNGRTDVKADLARIINEGGGQWYLDRLQRRIPGFGMTYGEVASQLSDGNAILGRREPSLAESVLATQDMNREYVRVKEALVPHPDVTCLIKIGSTGWAENFDVRGVMGDPSDLDLEAIIEKPNPDILKGFPGGPEQMELFGEQVEQGNADYFSFSYQVDGRPISIHFMTREAFERHCAIDYEHLDHEVKAREFRIKPKSKSPVYDERYNGKGKEYVFRGQPRLLEGGGQVTETPVMMIGDDGELVMGLVMSKYFTYPPVDGDRQFFETNIARFKTSVARRLERDGGTFSNLPARKQRMPYYILEQLDEEQQWIRQNF